MTEQDKKKQISPLDAVLDGREIGELDTTGFMLGGTSLLALKNIRAKIALELLEARPLDETAEEFHEWYQKKLYELQFCDHLLHLHEANLELRNQK